LKFTPGLNGIPSDMRIAKVQTPTLSKVFSTVTDGNNGTFTVSATSTDTDTLSGPPNNIVIDTNCTYNKDFEGFQTVTIKINSVSIIFKGTPFSCASLPIDNTRTAEPLVSGRYQRINGTWITITSPTTFDYQNAVNGVQRKVQYNIKDIKRTCNTQKWTFRYEPVTGVCEGGSIDGCAFPNLPTSKKTGSFYQEGGTNKIWIDDLNAAFG
jgi:hypothetical protein